MKKRSKKAARSGCAPRACSRRPDEKDGGLDPEAFARWRDFVKPIFIDMRKRNIRSMTIERTVGERCRFVMNPEESSENDQCRTIERRGKGIMKDRNESIALLSLLADIRAAVGDPNGKLMQDELVQRCRHLKQLEEWVETDGHRVKARRLKDGWMVKNGPTFNATVLFDR